MHHPRSPRTAVLLSVFALVGSLAATLHARPHRHRRRTPAPTPVAAPAPAQTPTPAPAPTPTPTPTTGGARVTVSGALPPRTGRFTAHLTVDGESREVEMVVPTRREASAPLLVLLHGTNGAGGQILEEGAIEAYANSHGIVVAAPTSRWRPTGDWDHPNGAETYWETHPNRDPDRNPDLALVRAILDQSLTTYAIDRTRVYLAGHSNGAFFALFAAMIFHDRIAAFAENSGGLVRCGTTPGCHFSGHGTTCAALASQRGFCTCSGPNLPIDVVASGNRPAAFLAHGTDDSIVTVAYTCDLERALRGAGYDVSVSLRDGEGHMLPESFIGEAWPFLARHRLP